MTGPISARSCWPSTGGPAEGGYLGEQRLQPSEAGGIMTRCAETQVVAVGVTLLEFAQTLGGWMRRTRLVCAIGVSLLSAVVSGSQAAPAALSGALRAHVKNERFNIVSSIRGLPLGVREGLQMLFGGQGLDIARDIAEPGAKFQVTDVVVTPRLPIRRLIAAGCSIERCLVYYERGGIAHTWHVALFHWTPAATRFEWGGSAPGGLAIIDDVRNAILSGAIKGSARFW